MAADRWVGVHWPEAYGGRGAPPVQVAIYQTEYARSMAPQPVNRVGINLVGPTLLAHGTEDQRRCWMPAILSADEIWCQLFSEPDAGSDLASLSTRAVPVDGGYVVNGRKVWTSYAQFADWGLCLARTDPDAPNRQSGISALAVDMHAEGVEIRPLVQLTGDAEFNEVFFTDVFVPADRLVGAEGRGGRWPARPWPTSGAPTSPSKSRWCTRPTCPASTRRRRRRGRWTTPWWPTPWPPPGWSWAVLRLHNLRTLTRLGRGEEPGPESSWVKLTWTAMTQHMAEAGLLVTDRATGSGLAGPWARQWLWSGAAGIAGGTSEIQRTSSPDGSWGCPGTEGAAVAGRRPAGQAPRLPGTAWCARRGLRSRGAGRSRARLPTTPGPTTRCPASGSGAGVMASMRLSQS